MDIGLGFCLGLLNRRQISYIYFILFFQKTKKLVSLSSQLYINIKERERATFSESKQYKLCSIQLVDLLDGAITLSSSRSRSFYLAEVNFYCYGNVTPALVVARCRWLLFYYWREQNRWSRQCCLTLSCWKETNSIYWANPEPGHFPFSRFKFSPLAS